MKIARFKINYFQTSKDKLKFEILNAIYLLIFIIPLILVIVFEISEVFFLISFIFLLIPIFLVMFNRIMPNASLIVEDKELNICYKKNKINILFSEISSIDISKSNKVNETYFIFYVKMKNNEVTKFIVDKFYFIPAKVRTNKIINEFNKHSVIIHKGYASEMFI